MQTHIRAIIGFLLGLLLAALAFLLSGAGHGTYVPMIANVSVLAFIPLLGILIAVFGPPFLWAGYFILIPAIVSRVKRTIALALVAIFHLIPPLWLAFRDSAFDRALQSHRSILTVRGLALTFAIICLVYVSSKLNVRS